MQHHEDPGHLVFWHSYSVKRATVLAKFVRHSEMAFCMPSFSLEDRSSLLVASPKDLFNLSLNMLTAGISSS